MNCPPGFEEVRDGRTVLWVRSDLRTWMVPLLQHSGGTWEGYQTGVLPGGRGGTLLVHAAAHPPVVVRPCRRGGLPGRLVQDLYVGWRPRPFGELCATEWLIRRGAPVVAVYGAAIRWVVPGCYRGWVVTPYITGAVSLWTWAQRHPPAAERQVVLRQIGTAIRRLHDCGGRHPDLNLNNVLIQSSAPTATPQVLLIDFDRARPAVSRADPAADLARLERSARKLDPAQTCLGAADFRAVRVAYAGGAL